MKIFQCDQRSEEWHKLRLGIPTASCFNKILTPKTMKLSSQAEAYSHVLLAEWIYGAPLDDPESTFQSHAMQFGQDMEPQARAEYELLTDNAVAQVGFVTNDAGTVGCSPDGLIGDNGGLELKGHTALPRHVKHMLARAIDEDHKAQVQGCLWLCERDWWDVVSYFPGAPTVIVRAYRDEKFIAALAPALDAFCETLANARLALDREYGITQLKASRGKVAKDDPLGITDEDVKAMWEARNG